MTLVLILVHAAGIFVLRLKMMLLHFGQTKMLQRNCKIDFGKITDLILILLFPYPAKPNHIQQRIPEDLMGSTGLNVAT